ncbi:hypothetical protein MAHJHV29_48340 [Mycobacterium avium subsp. hominissuis]
MSYERLRRQPLQRPCPPQSTADRNPIRYLNDGVGKASRGTVPSSRTSCVWLTPSLR